MEGGTSWERKKNGSGYTARDIRFTTKGNDLYAICLDWPGEQVTIESLRVLWKSEIKSIKMLGISEELEWSLTDEGLTIKTPDTKPGEHAYTFRISL